MLRPPDDGHEWIPIVLFPNQGFGYGFGPTRLGIGQPGQTTLPTPPEGYHHTQNMSVRDGRTLSPSFAASASYPISATVPPSAVVPWETTAGVPTVLVLVGGVAKLLQAGLLTDETDATTDTYGNATFWDDGTNALLVAGTGGSKFVQKRTQAGSWTAAADADRKATYVAEAGGALYGNPTAYQVAKWAAGNDPTGADPGTTIRVGTPAADINSIGAIGGSPIVGKEDGIWTFNADGDFQNDFPMNPHPHNFPFMRPDGQGGILTATWDGSLVRIQKFGNITSIHPLRDKSPDRAAPRGRIVDAVVYQDHIYVLHAPYARMTQPPGLVFYRTTDAGATYTDMSGSVIDGRLDTVGDISDMTTVGTDWLLLGSDAPFCAVQFTLATLNTATARLKMGVLLTSSLNRIDLTTAKYDGTNSTPTADATPWGQSGVLAWTGSNTTNWPEVTMTINGSSVSKYWLMLYLE